MRNAIIVKTFALCPLFLLILSGAVSGSEFGVCPETVDVRLLGDGRKMELTKDYIYTDQRSKAWKAPTGSVVDGASIPKPLWSFIGSPLVGLYRNASITHDVECKDEKTEWRAVHRMFYEAMRCADVPEYKAKIMYAAVYQCGPRWGKDQGVRYFPCDEGILPSHIRRWKELVRTNQNISLSDLENTDKQKLISQTKDPIGGLIDSIGKLASVSENNGEVRISIPYGSDEEDSSVATQVADDISVALQNYPGVTILVEGHSDSTGDAISNMVLSEQRARAVEGRLVAKGMSKSDVSTISYGERKPISMGDSDSDNEQNRRVEILIREEL
jgi:outer membrane protein OmpA-like peptidoglycan-associated protein